MVYNKATYTGFIAESAITNDSVCADPLQFCIEAAESDHKLFEALITVDMTEVANNNGTINLSESDLSYMAEAAEEGIFAKLKALIAKFKEAIQNVITKFTTFISNLVANDKKIYEKYKEHVTSAKVKSCDLKGEVVNTSNYNKLVDLANDTFDIAISAADKTDDVANIKKSVSTMEKNLEEMKQIKFIDSDALINTDFSNAIETVKIGYKDKVAKAQNAHKQNENVIKNAQLEVEQAQRDATTKRDTERANKAYEGISKILSINSATMSVLMSAMKRSIAIERANFIKVGNWVAKGAKSSSTNEAVNMLIDITSDSYCESAWEEA